MILKAIFVNMDYQKIHIICILDVRNIPLYEIAMKTFNLNQINITDSQILLWGGESLTVNLKQHFF